MTNDDTSSSTSGTGVWPCLRYRDAPAALDFLTGVLGFTETARYGDGDQIGHAQIRWPGGGGVMLGSEKPGDDMVPVAVGTVYLVMPSEAETAALYERVQASAGRVVRPLQRPDYGGSEFAVADPEGVVWSIGTYAGE